MKLIPPVWTLLSLITISALDHFAPSVSLFSKPWTLVGYGIMPIGFLIVLYCALQFRKYQTTIHPGRTPTKLIATGIYTVSRNPIYLAMAIFIAGFAISTGNLVTFPVPFIFIAIITHLFIKPEEHILNEQFGDDYCTYCNTTRRWI